ncbi:MAG: acetylornithine deacetylase [Phycisphaerales bacterium]|nr:acetylornithine deacetylase [Phycisphaerales bacterium]NNM27262.1 acetylornithine deacetylase [Phycisphaerales bacterium]
MSKRLSDRGLLARLVAFDSVSSRPNRPIADFLCAYLEDAGVRVERDEHDGGAKVNVRAAVGPDPGPTRDGLLLCGHLDVVPADEPEWDGDPFTLRAAGDRLYGRGTTDMKGFVALAVNRLCAAADTHAAPLVLLLTCDEEVGGIGAQRLSARWGPERWPRATVIGEPTQLRVVRMHKGHLKLRVTVEGRAAHSGSPQLGINAIARATPVLSALDALRATLAGERAPASVFFPEVPAPVLNIGRIEGGSAVNVVPDRCVIDVGVRLLPGASVPAFLERFEASVGDDARVEVVNDNPPMESAAGTPLDTCARSLVDQTESIGVSFASDGGVLQRDLGCVCILFGPGDMAVAHRPNEYLETAELTRGAALLEQLVAHAGVEDAMTEQPR